ncbi:conserved protein of unknown function [Shewanella benthica]|uniref:Solute-binding protein family 3/N-terminal domain-containing protein n=1 Tax=Shewanella benthica TaxID=43661 RepID=A0A330M1F4_9GAMM|nr:conserved protein of unknown function [Shewanella benthica]
MTITRLLQTVNLPKAAWRPHWCSTPSKNRVNFVSAAPYDAIKALLEAGVSPKEVQRSEFVVTEIPLHVIVPKHIPKAQDIIDAFNKGLIILRENGRYEVLKQECNWLE